MPYAAFRKRAVGVLNHALRGDKCYCERDVWLRLETAQPRLSMRYQTRPRAPWKRFKTVVGSLSEPVVAVPKR